MQCVSIGGGMAVPESATGSYQGLELPEALHASALRDEQIAILIERVRQLEKMCFGPRSAKRSAPIDPRELRLS